MKKGEIWLVDLPYSDGHEQTGSRPVIILLETNANVSLVVPFTSNLQALRFPHTIEVKPSKANGLSSISIALVFQMRAIDKSRLKKSIGLLEESKIEELNNMLKEMLRL